MKRFIYLIYYFKKMNWKQLRHFLIYTSGHTKRTYLGLLWSAISDSLRYNISLLEYFQFRFFEKAKEEKINWAGTGFMYEFQRTMNPPEVRGILDDKRLFYKYYGTYMLHQVADLVLLKQNATVARQLLNNPSGRIVFKGATGKCGAEVSVRNTSEFTPASLVLYLENSPYDLVEEFIIQHSDLNDLSPSAVNTVRIFTQLNLENEVDILGCRLRISVNSKVDNLAAGNMAAPIDEKTGIVTGKGVYSDIAKKAESVHPVTHKGIEGYVIPFWYETLDLVKKAAKMHPQNRSIGWDVVITEKGPGLIEGNHDWCKLLWQLPVKKGLKNELLKYIK
ncbi:hexapeptide transferase [Chryseotalea sanaruensis]|uniref:Hexapeptide transferase n=1 Tax=Chryseotalea sanaruensis TaxID=2482724 RepID=A0A401U6K7_9BACT|nr:sugar-transfer associated ATP-grasp domain-containing protein [Chryseotalea sanaruensis]GCC50594.1 hexapeptide transferase [Chryseotalea sanaruensis]